MREQGGYHKSDQYLGCLRETAKHQQDNNDGHGKKSIAQVGKIDKKNVEGRPVIMVQVKKGGRLAFMDQEKESYQEEEKKGGEKKTVVYKYGS